eukprot:3653669-Lingulodinium_polyedra.AAC.1
MLAQRGLLSLLGLAFHACDGRAAGAILRFSPQLRCELAAVAALGPMARADWRVQPPIQADM